MLTSVPAMARRGWNSAVPVQAFRPGSARPVLLGPPAAPGRPPQILAASPGRLPQILAASPGRLPQTPAACPGRLLHTRLGRAAGIGRGVTFRPRARPTGPGERREHGRNRRIEGLVFPDPDDVPARSRERGVRPPASLDVAPQLGPPVPGVVGRLAAVLRAGVPEAAVHEHGDAPRCERDVGPDSLAFR